MSIVRLLGATGFAFALAAGTLVAQPTGVQGGGTQQRPPGQQGQRGQPAQDRAQREQVLRENLARQLKSRLQLTDEQMTKLVGVNQRLDGARRELFDRERGTRNALRTELAQPDARVNSARVGELLDQLIQLQKERLGLVEREQRELAAFLNPIQRARYQAFTDQLQRRMDEMDGPRDGRDGRGGPGGPGGGRGGRGRGGPPPAGTGTKPPPPATQPPPMR
jgi:hypothetical protein